MSEWGRSNSLIPMQLHGKLCQQQLLMGAYVVG